MSNEITSILTDATINLQRTIRQNAEARTERTREMYCPACGSLSGFINRQQLLGGGEYVNVTFQRIADENGSRGTCPCCSKGISAGLSASAFAERMSAFGITIVFNHETGARR